MATVEFSRVISFPKDDRSGEARTTVTVERAYQLNPRGREFCNLQTGEWVVRVNTSIFSGSELMPPDAARMLALAIAEAADEVDRRNAPNPETT